MADFNIKMGLVDGMVVTESLLTEERDTVLTDDGEAIDLWANSTALVDNSLLLDQLEAKCRANGISVVRGCREERSSTAATYEWLCIGLFVPARLVPSWDEESDLQPSEADCLSQMFADEGARMHP